MVEGTKKGTKKITQVSTLGTGWNSCLLWNFYVGNDLVLIDVQEVQTWLAVILSREKNKIIQIYLL